ncbi:MAG: ABC transporter ATP-binding protein [Gammaproteobacteria bacterium]
MDNVIHVKNLSKHFGPVLAVKDVSFSVGRGEVLGFLGPNGAGKSTTMKVITGFLSPSRGTISLCGHDVMEEPIKAKKNIGYLPEGAPAYGEMTPRGFLEFIADIRALDGAKREQRIRQVVSMVHLESVLDRPIETLSKGFKRRVGIAQAILHDPQVLIMDEPTDGLDPNQKHEVRTLIKEMAKNKAIIISTHILEEVDAVCNRAIIIADGRIVFSGTPSELAAKSRLHNAVTLSLLSQHAQSAQEKIKALDSVAALEQQPSSDSLVRLLVIPRNGRSVVNAIGRLVQTHRWELDELHVETGRLDEVFRAITTGEHGRT